MEQGLLLLALFLVLEEALEHVLRYTGFPLALVEQFLLELSQAIYNLGVISSGLRVRLNQVSFRLLKLTYRQVRAAPPEQRL